MHFGCGGSNSEPAEEETQMNTTSLVGCLALVLLAPVSALGQDRTWEWQWGMHPMMFMWGAGGLVMMLMMLVFWGLIIAGLILGVRWLAGQGRGGGRDEALEILRQRYARGDIDKQEFDARKRDLGV
jgi:putative membrane protein